MALDRILAYAGDLPPGALKRGAVVAEIAGLARAARSRIFRIEIQHDFLSFVS